MPGIKRISNGLLVAATMVSAASIGVAAIGPSTSVGAEETSSAAPSMLRRLTETQYRQSIADIFGADIKVIGRFEPDLRVHGLLAVGASAISITPGGFERYDEIARGIAAQVTDKSHRGELVGCGPTPSDPDGAQCAEAFIRKFGLRLYRRPVPDGEVRSLTTLAIASTGRLGDYHAGLAAALARMLVSPQFLFRIDAPGRNGEIDGFSKASRLSFLLWNSSPDAALLDAAARGRLDTQAGLAAEVDRLIASPRFVEGARAFFSDYLRLDTMDSLSKDAQIYPAFTAAATEAAREQTLRTIADLLIARDGDFREIFTTRRFAMERTLGPLYDIPISRSGWYIHEFPESDPRAGLLTHASLLALHSHPGRTSPTLRGMAVQEALLCTEVPAPPANVNFTVVQDVDNPNLKTTRQRLQGHLDDIECASCHRITDPIGLGLEKFDGAGQFRSVEQGEPIDVTGTHEKMPFDGAVELGKIFHDSKQVIACFVDTAWSYAHGRQPSPGEAADVARLEEQFGADGYRFASLIRSIALDPGFVRMTPPARQAPRNALYQVAAEGVGMP